MISKAHLLMLALLFSPVLLQNSGIQFTERKYQYERETKVPEQVLKVSGEASCNIPHDRVTLSFTASAINKNPNEALEVTTEATRKAVDALAALGLNRTEYETQAFSINKKHESVYRHWKQQYDSVFIGYEVRNSISVQTSKLDLAGNIINTVIASGIKEVDSVQFSVNEEKYAAEREKLIAQAIQDAKEKAQLSLAPLGYEISKVKLLDMESSSPTPYFGGYGIMAADMAGGRSAAPAPILGSTQDIDVKVRVEFLIAKV